MIKKENGLCVQCNSDNIEYTFNIKYIENVPYRQILIKCRDCNWNNYSNNKLK